MKRISLAALLLISACSTNPTSEVQPRVCPGLTNWSDADKASAKLQLNLVKSQWGDNAVLGQMFGEYEVDREFVRACRKQ